MPPEAGISWFRTALERGEITAEEAQRILDERKAASPEVAAARGTASADARDVLDASPTLPLLSFAAAQERLAGRLDLAVALDEYVDLSVRSGRLTKDVDEYRDLLRREATISEPGLASALALNRPLAALFRVKPCSLSEAFASLGESGVRTYDWTTVANYAHIDPRTRQPYTKTPLGRGPTADILLTPDDQEVSDDMRGTKSPNDFLADMKTMAQQGISFLDPDAWVRFFLLRAHRGLVTLKPDELAAVTTPAAYKDLLERTLIEERDGVFPIDQYLPDVHTRTFFPDARNRAGDVLGFDWDPHRGSRRVSASGWYSSVPYGGAGPRLVFG